MAEIARVAASLSSTTPTPENKLSGCLAGATIADGDALYLNADGKLYPASGAALNANARVVGFAPKGASAGEPVSAYRNCRFNYGTGMTPGSLVYLSATVAGGLSTTATTGGVTPLGFVMNDGKRIQFGSLI